MDTQLRRKLQVDLRDKQKLKKMVSILSKKPILLIIVLKNGLFIVYSSGVWDLVSRPLPEWFKN